jgi:hypothetical protein
LKFNSPHNAPMWRKSLHDDIGFFDTSFNSAADWEFWLRCIFNRKRFFKLNRPHVGYYYNPEGLSTNLNVGTMEEISRIAVFYSERSISTQMSSPKRFVEAIGLAPNVEALTMGSYARINQPDAQDPCLRRYAATMQKYPAFACPDSIPGRSGRQASQSRKTQ